MKPFALLLAVVFLSACQSMGRVEKDAAAVDADGTVFVMGVSPALANISFFSGVVRKGQFRQNPFANAAFMGNPEQGFIVGKGGSDEALALIIVRWQEPGQMSMPIYWACGGRQRLVFDTPKGRVIYVGDLDFDYASKRLAVKRGEDIEKARAHLAAHYPALKDRLEPQPVQQLPVAGECGMTIMVPSAGGGTPTFVNIGR